MTKQQQNQSKEEDLYIIYFEVFGPFIERKKLKKIEYIF
jgi:hypothetical protein